MSKRPRETPTESLAGKDVVDNFRRSSSRLRDKHRLSGGIVQQSTPSASNVAQSIVGGNVDQVPVRAVPRLTSSKPDRKRHCTSPRLPSSDIFTAPPGGSATASPGPHMHENSPSLQECSRHTRRRSKPDGGIKNCAGSPGGLCSSTPGHTAISYGDDDSASAVLPGLALAGPAALRVPTRSGKLRKDSGVGSKPARRRLTLGQPLDAESLDSDGKEQVTSSKNEEQTGTTDVGRATEPPDILGAVPFIKGGSLVRDQENTSIIAVMHSPHKSVLGASKTIDASSTADLALSNNAESSSVSFVLPREQSVVAQVDTQIGRSDTVVRSGNNADLSRGVGLAPPHQMEEHGASVGEPYAKTKGELQDMTEETREQTAIAPVAAVSCGKDLGLPGDGCNMRSILKNPSAAVRSCMLQSNLSNVMVEKTCQTGSGVQTWALSCSPADGGQQEVQPSNAVITERVEDQKLAATGKSAYPGGDKVGLPGMQLHLNAVSEAIRAHDVIVPFVKTALSGTLMPIETGNNQKDFGNDSTDQQQLIKSWIATSPDPTTCDTAGNQANISSDGSHEEASAVETAGGSLCSSDVGFKVCGVDSNTSQTLANGNATVMSAIGDLTRRPWADTSTLHDTTVNDNSSGDELPSVLDGNYAPVVFGKDMLVWYKYQKDPFWPAVIESSNKAKFILRFLNYGPPECSRLSISKRSARERLVEYPGSKHAEFTEAGKQYKDPKAFEAAVNQADDYIRGRALQTITAGPCEHFRALYEKPKAEHSARAASALPHVSGTGLARLEHGRPATAAAGPGTTCGTGTSDPAAAAAAELDAKREPDAGSGDSSSAETEDDVEASDDQGRPTSAPVFRYSRKTEAIIDSRRRYCASLLEILRSDKGRLRELMRNVESGAIDSPFKREFQPDSRRLPLGFRGPIEDDDQYQELFNDLLVLYRNDVVPGCDITPSINAVMFVMFPEVVVQALVEKEGITRAEALSIFRAGVKYTDEELRRPVEISLSSSFTHNLGETESNPWHSPE